MMKQHLQKLNLSRSEIQPVGSLKDSYQYNSCSFNTPSSNSTENHYMKCDVDKSGKDELISITRKLKVYCSTYQDKLSNSQSVLKSLKASFTQLSHNMSDLKAERHTYAELYSNQISQKYSQTPKSKPSALFSTRSARNISRNTLIQTAMDRSPTTFTSAMSNRHSLIHTAQERSSGSLSSGFSSTRTFGRTFGELAARATFK